MSRGRTRIPFESLEIKPLGIRVVSKETNKIVDLFIHLNKPVLRQAARRFLELVGVRDMVRGRVMEFVLVDWLATAFPDKPPPSREFRLISQAIEKDLDNISQIVHMTCRARGLKCAKQAKVSLHFFSRGLVNGDRDAGDPQQLGTGLENVHNFISIEHAQRLHPPLDALESAGQIENNPKLALPVTEEYVFTPPDHFRDAALEVLNRVGTQIRKRLLRDVESMRPQIPFENVRNLIALISVGMQQKMLIVTAPVELILVKAQRFPDRT